MTTTPASNPEVTPRRRDPLVVTAWSDLRNGLEDLYYRLPNYEARETFFTSEI